MEGQPGSEQGENGLRMHVWAFQVVWNHVWKRCVFGTFCWVETTTSGGLHGAKVPSESRFGLSSLRQGLFFWFICRARPMGPKIGLNRSSEVHSRVRCVPEGAVCAPCPPLSGLELVRAGLGRYCSSVGCFRPVWVPGSPLRIPDGFT